MKKTTNSGKNRLYSISKKLRKDGKSSEEFEILLNNLTLEEVIGLKLEISSKYSLNGKLYGLPIWQSLTMIVKDAVLKYSLSATRTKKEAARFLGLTERSLTGLVKKYNSESYFSEEIDN